MLAFNDPYSLRDLVTSAVVGGITGGIAQSIIGSPTVSRPPELDADGPQLMQHNLDAIGQGQVDGFNQLLTEENEAFEQNYTKDNFRKNLIKLTGEDPGSDIQAHHNLPAKIPRYI